MRCWKCGTVIESRSGPLKLAKSDSCPGCDLDLHVCRNCRFHDRASHNECRENQAEWVRDKEKRNYCDYFEPNTTAESKQDVTPKARSEFNKLFG